MMSTATTHFKTEKRLVPALRFKEFDDSWDKEKLLGHVNSISSGKIKPVKKGKYLVYGSTGVIGKSDKFTHDGDYLLIARVGANAGKINRVKGKYAVTDNTLIIDLKDNIDVAFCESFLIKFDLNRLIFGSGQPLITGGLLKSLDFIFPDFPEQQKIASFLSAVDQKIQQLTTKKELLEQYKKGVMQQLFSGKLRFKNEDGNDYPDWEEKRLGEVGKIITGSTPPTSNPDYYNGEYLFVSPADINTSRYIVSTKTSITQLAFSKGRKIAKGAVLFVCIGSTISKVAQAGSDCITNQQINAIVALKEYSNEFIYSLLELFGSRIKLLAGVQAVPLINKTEFSKLKYKFPRLEEQQKIATYLSSIDTKIESVNTQITQTQTFKKGLLQQMFV